MYGGGNSDAWVNSITDPELFEGLAGRIGELLTLNAELVQTLEAIQQQARLKAEPAGEAA